MRVEIKKNTWVQKPVINQATELKRLVAHSVIEGDFGQLEVLWYVSLDGVCIVLGANKDEITLARKGVQMASIYRMNDKWQNFWEEGEGRDKLGDWLKPTRADLDT